MSNRVILIIGFWLWPCVVCFGQMAQPSDATKQTTVVNPHDNEFFAWFDTLGLSDFAERKFIRVATRDVYEQVPDRQPRGFLLKEDEQAFTVFWLDLGIKTFPKQGQIPAETAHFTVLDLVNEATAFIKRFAEPVDKKGFGRNFGSKTTERVQAVVLACACAAQGLPEEAHTLLKQAAVIGERDPAKPLARDQLQAALTVEIGNTLIWQHVLALGDPSIERPELLRRFRHYVKVFPNSEHAQRALQTAATLARMVEEDVDHAKTARPFDHLTQQERIADLIYQLRDQNGQQLSQPGACSVFADPRDFDVWGFREKRAQPRSRSPATQLVGIGYDAVPQLIEHLGDEQLSRSIGFHRDFYFSHRALRVGECIEQILTRISGRGFFEPNLANRNLSAAERADVIRKAANAWWAEVQKKGERQILIDDTTKGGPDALTQAERLAEKYPDDALAPIASAVKKSTYTSDRTYLLQILGEVPGDAVTEYLLNTMNNRLEWEVRLTAGRELFFRQHAAVGPAMIREWQQYRKPSMPPKDQPFAQRNYDEQANEIIEVLAKIGSVDTLRTLANGLPQLPPRQRSTIISELQYREHPSGYFIDFKTPPLTPDANRVCEEMLAKRLDDAAESDADNSDGHVTRICDRAAEALAKRWPSDYSFDLDAPLDKRNDQLAVVKKVWRRKQ